MDRRHLVEFEPTGEGGDGLTQSELGQKLNVLKLCANLGDVLPGYMELVNALRFKGKLDPVIREMAIVRVSHLAHSEYDRHYHDKMLEMLGVEREIIDQIYSWPDSPSFDDFQNGLMRMVDESFHQYRCSDETFAFLSGKLGRQEFHELVMNIGFYMMSCLYFNTFDLELETDWEELAEEAYLPVVQSAAGR